MTGQITTSVDSISVAVDGIEYEQGISWTLTEPGFALISALPTLSLELDDPGRSATSGNVVGGRFKIDDVYYCVDGGTFSRPDETDPDVLTVSLTSPLPATI